MFNWLKNLSATKTLKRENKKLRTTNEKFARNLVLLRAILGGNKPGAWSTDHYQETLKYRGWVYAAINAKMTQCRQSDLETEMEDGNYAKWFLNNPNPYETRKAFEAKRCMQLELTGTCVVWNVPEEHTDLPERYIIPTALLVAQRNGYFQFSMTNLSTVYWREIPSRLLDIIMERLPFEECSIYRYAHPFNLGDGMSPVSAGAFWIDTADQIDIARFNYNANAMRPGGIVTEDETCELSKEDWEGFKAELMADHGGPENQGKYLKLPRGLTLDNWMKSAEELQQMESFIQQRDAIFGLFGVPPLAAGYVEAASYSQYFAAMLQFIENVIQPYLDWIAAEDKKVLENEFDWYGFSEVDGFRYRARRLDDPEVTDREKKRELEFIKEKIQSNCYTKNEIRAAFGDGPAPEGIDGNEAAGGLTTTKMTEDEAQNKVKEGKQENTHTNKVDHKKDARADRTNINRPEKVI